MASIKAKGFVELLAGHIAYIHGGEHSKQEEATPKPRSKAIDGLGLGLHQGVKEITVAILVLAPVFKEIENWEDFAFGVFFEVAIDGDIAPIANFLRKIGGVKDIGGFEIGVGLVGCQEAEIELQAEISHGLVQKAGMTRFIPGHVGKAFGQKGIFVLDTPAHFFVEQETGEF